MRKKVAQLSLVVVMIALGPSATSQAIAQEAEPAPVPPISAPPQRSPADLERLVAPIALYPDPLLAVLLPAAVYPAEVVQAARFVSDTNNLARLDDQPWDENVKAVARFASVIRKMDQDLGWTVELGQAFVQQPSELMDAIQTLRAQAQSVGTLQPTPQQVVIVTNAVVERTYESQIVYVTNTVIQIMPASPQVIYVPIYNPVVVYAPPPGYVYSPAAPLITFGVGIAAGIIIANNHCNWHYGGVYYGRGGFVVWGGSGRYPYYPPPPHYRPPPYYPPPGYRPPPPGYRPPGYPPPGSYPPRPTPYPGNRPTTLPANSGSGPPQRWQPDPNRAVINGGSGSLPSASTREARGWPSGSGAPSSRPNSGAGASPVTRPANVAQLPARNTPTPSQPAYKGPTPSQNVTRPTPPPATTRPAPSQPMTRPSQPTAGQSAAFGGGSPSVAPRDASSRGAASRVSSGGSSRGARR